MAGFVKAADIAAAAVEIERRGRDMYLAAQRGAGNTADAAFFAFMAEEEEGHEKFFSSMLQRLGGLALSTESSEAEYLEYLQLLLDSHALLLPGFEKRLASDPLAEAMRMEKDTILFFSAMKRLVPEAEQSAVESCIEEERRHLKMLSKHKPV